MTTVTSYPGVYIEELNSLALSVSNSATAVPVFAVNEQNKHINEDTATRINSWMDYLNLIGEFDNKDKLAVSLRAYFANGGGYCYLVQTKSLEKIIPTLDDVTLLVAAGEEIKTSVDTLCQAGKGLFAIFDGPKDELTISGATDAKGKYTATQFAAVYYPWLKADWTGKDTDIPPSAAMAGVYASVDLSRGVWKAPANVALKGGLEPKFLVTDALQGEYNSGLAINMIRNFSNTGTTVWGARTLEDSDNWRYVPVRRLFNTVERDVKRAMSFAMFEPNSQPTWERVRAAISNYLHSLWQQGGLAGSKEEEAYFVQIGKGITMTPDQINQGQMIVKVGLAAVRPAEFIILQFTQDVEQR
ncbi:phage tail sheath subtilisin-like domain-containing protein [Xenorhabdus bovienii]|uniref:Phage tail sheath protein n=1 Tax=Xenorhabdus bovienii str. Intermedium TaxID=1379677 RepID=A0A077Q7G5_XENBV|nr:phage tail sheath C-terminal domain-containing protein [Xenorhabdus bovienii]MDE1485575.1 phage tail sheath subtilisin-like domain-containing protein [Xenorhabdus bovienii]MDE9476143.1 phage tail sheath subtilisin-like domain-containing protein [Xenorhabdus bovienii]MDE9481481.1 phage tail sheath subtilisin-like domain-containing protein [Xenorhabdus bovienii]MDE9517015.1 phage tail sheath subtilisin-like domain-containing protein [Xenorhabdus bovienii]MDE9529035.1 phage tail sheath subtili